jgi:hypothetical protein
VRGAAVTKAWAPSNKPSECCRSGRLLNDVPALDLVVQHGQSRLQRISKREIDPQTADLLVLTFL